MIIHTVQPGETYFAIAARYGISLSLLLQTNGISDPDSPIIGQALVILKPALTHIVTRGETLQSVALRYQTTLRTLLRNNPVLTASDPPQKEFTIFPGQQLVISYETTPLGDVRSGGYVYPFISPSDLDQSLPYLNDLYLFTYGFKADGTLIPITPDDTPSVNAAEKLGTSPILVLSTLGEDGLFDSGRASALFSDPAAEDRLISSLLALMPQKGYRGVDVDFEFIPPDQKEEFVAFVTLLKQRLAPQGYSVTVALAPKTYADQPGLLYEAHDYAALGNAADRLLLMTYEWGYAFGPPGPVAPIKNVERVIDYALTEIPREKLLLGIPNYGYDWTLPYQRGNPRAITLSPKQALSLASRYGAEILFDQDAASPYFYYTDGQGRAHVVHFEDARSFREKLELLFRKGLSGFTVWTSMYPTPSLLRTANALFRLS